MTWLRLDDRFANHPKILALSDREFRAHVLALCYAAEYETGGNVPRSAWKSLWITEGIARKFVELGLWDSEGEIHDFRLYNPVDPTSAERKRAFRARSRTVPGAPVENVPGAFLGNDEGTAEERAGNGSVRAHPVPSPTPIPQTFAVDDARDDDDDEQQGFEIPSDFTPPTLRDL